MKRILLALLALGFVGNAQAQTSCAARLVAPFTPAEATKLCQEFSSAVGQSLIPSTTNSFDLGSSTRTWRDLWLGRNLTTTATDALIASNTIDGADNKRIYIASGGTFGQDRGAFIEMRGNEFASFGGTLSVNAGTTTNAALTLNANASNGFVGVNTNGQQRWIFFEDGTLRNNGSQGGDLHFSRSGTTVQIQEATPASACMGVATPNGNTAVTVTTSCAVSGARVFYTRVGAVTNMGTISTTTNPNGTSFQFASTGATDTLASSVVWLIVKESA